MSKNCSLYWFIANLSNELASKEFLRNSVIISDAGNTGFVVSQEIKLKEGMRYITSGAQMDMGFALPASIGVAMATKNPIIAIIGDGSFQFNIQELATIVYHKLPIKIFVINNNGYGCCRNTQKKFFKGDFIGIDKESGLGFPELKKIAGAYGIGYIRWNDTLSVMNKIVNNKKPMICEVFTDPDEVIKSPFVK